MRILCLESDVVDLAHSILGEPKSATWNLQRAAETWRAVQGKKAVTEMGAALLE